MKILAGLAVTASAVSFSTKSFNPFSHWMIPLLIYIFRRGSQQTHKHHTVDVKPPSTQHNMAVISTQLAELNFHMLIKITTVTLMIKIHTSSQSPHHSSLVEKESEMISMIFFSLVSMKFPTQMFSIFWYFMIRMIVLLNLTPQQISPQCQKTKDT